MEIIIIVLATITPAIIKKNTVTNVINSDIDSLINPDYNTEEVPAESLK